MRLDRIIRRNQYKHAFPAFRPNQRLALIASLAGLPIATRQKTYHKFLVDAGLRHPDAFKNLRAARTMRGLAPTSSDMHHVLGARV